MTAILFFTFYAISILFSCSDEDRSIHLSSSCFGKDSINFTFEKFTIPYSKTKFNNQNIISQYFIVNEVVYASQNDCLSQKIHFYLVPTFDLSFSVQIPKEYIDLCKLRSYNYWTNDLNTFYFLTDQEVLYKYIDSEKSWTQYKISEILPKDYDQEYGLDYKNILSAFDDQNVYITAVYGKKQFKKTKRPFHTIKLDLVSKRSYVIGPNEIPHWSEINYGLLGTTPDQYSVDSLLIYSFGFNSEMVVHHKGSSRSIHVNPKSKFDLYTPQELSRKSNRDELWAHLKKNGYYDRLVYNPWTKIYYRFYHLPIPDKLENGQYSVIQDRRVSIMRLDENFNCLGEILLPQPISFIYLAVPYKEGLIINYGPAVDVENNGLNLLKIK